MFNRSALSQNLPPAIAPTIPSGMATAIHTPTASDLPVVGRFGWQRLASLFRLPTTLRGYMAFLAGLLVLAFTMTLHIMLSAEIMRLDVQLADLREEYARVERYNANIVWEISEYGALDRLHEQALAAGYVNNIPTEYVDMPAALGAATAGQLETLPVSGANDPTITDPAAPQPVYHVVLGEPSTGDGSNTTPGSVSSGEAPVETGAQGLGTLGMQQTQQNDVPAPEESWWNRTMPEWLRFEQVGNAIDESLDWIRSSIPSPQWLQERW
jgi:hypothetical protein